MSTNGGYNSARYPAMLHILVHLPEDCKTLKKASNKGPHMGDSTDGWLDERMDVCIGG